MYFCTLAVCYLSCWFGNICVCGNVEEKRRTVLKSSQLIYMFDIYKRSPDPFAIIYWLRDWQRIRTAFIWNAMQQRHGALWVVYKANEDLLSLARTGACPEEQETLRTTACRPEGSCSMKAKAIRVFLRSIWIQNCALCSPFPTYSLFENETGWIMHFLGLTLLPLRLASPSVFSSHPSWPVAASKSIFPPQNMQRYNIQATDWQHVQPLEMHDACMLAFSMSPQRKHCHTQEF